MHFNGQIVRKLIWKFFTFHQRISNMLHDSVSHEKLTFFIIQIFLYTKYLIALKEHP